MIDSISSRSELGDSYKTRVKERFIEKRGYWDYLWDDLLDCDPEFLDYYLDFFMFPWEYGKLAPKIKELIYIAIDVACTHLYKPGLRSHLRRAIGHGATLAEVVQVVELASLIGIHAANEGMPLLEEILENRGQSIEGKINPTSYSIEQKYEMKAYFIKMRGYWNESWELILSTTPGFFETYLHFSCHPWNGGSLERKTKELIDIAIDVACTSSYRPGLKTHMGNALDAGAEVEEIIEVIQLATPIGIHSCNVCLPIIFEEFKKLELEESNKDK